MPPYQILHLFETSNVEGTSFARILAALAGRLDPGQYRFHAWFRRDHGPLVQMLEERGVSVRVLDWQGGERDPAALWRFLRGVRRQRFAIFHQHVGGRAVRLISRYAGGARVITHLHGRVLEQCGDAPARCNVYGADLVIATSKTIARWSGVDAEVVYPGVDIPPPGQPAIRRSGHVIGAAGRLAPIKGIKFLVRAMPLVKSRVPDATLEIAGSGEEEGALREEVGRLGLTGSVRFLGWRDEVPFGRWDIFAMPSLEESFGISALEAMAAGLPVVASAAGGLAELVEDGKTGWLTPVSDPEALAARLVELLQDAREREAMGIAGRARANEFSTGRMTGQIEGLYRRLLAV